MGANSTDDSEEKQEANLITSSPKLDADKSSKQTFMFIEIADEKKDDEHINVAASVQLKHRVVAATKRRLSLSDIIKARLIQIRSKNGKSHLWLKVTPRMLA